MRPRGEPPTLSGRFSKGENSDPEFEVAGKTVERVAIEDIFRIRRARTADSWTVGMRCGEGKVDGGLAKMCCGEFEDEATEMREKRRKV